MTCDGVSHRSAELLESFPFRYKGGILLTIDIDLLPRHNSYLTRRLILWNAEDSHGNILDGSRDVQYWMEYDDEHNE